MSWFSETFTLKNIATAAMLVITGGQYGWYMAAAYAVSVEYNRSANKRAIRQAKADYNAAQKDRQILLRSTIPPRQRVYGIMPVGGSLIYYGTSGDKKQYLHLVVALADHEVDDITGLIVNDVLQPAWNRTTGFIETGAYVKGTRKNATKWQTATGTTATATFDQFPARVVSVVAGPKLGSYTPISSYSWSTASKVVTVTGVQPGWFVSVMIEYVENPVPLIRVTSTRGNHTTQPYPWLVSEMGGDWSATDLLLGTASVYVRIEFDQDIMSSFSLEQLKWVVRGAKTRSGAGTTLTYSANSARCLADYLRAAMSATDAELPDTELQAEALVCSGIVPIDASGTTQPRYLCNGIVVFDETTTRRTHIEQIAQTMAGTWCWSQGRWLYRAGIGRAATGDPITEDWIADGAIEISPEPEDVPTAIAVRYIEPDTLYAETVAPDVSNPLYLTWSGNYPSRIEMAMPLVHGSMRAQRMAKIALEKARQGAQTITLTANMRAFDLAVGDVKRLTIARYGIDADYEVDQWAFDPATRRVSLALRETSSSIWDWAYGNATLIDLTPNSNLPNPLAAPTIITGLAGVATDAEKLANPDGTAVIRAVLTWTPVADVRVAQGGSIEIEWAVINSAEPAWSTAPSVPGDSAVGWISGLAPGQMITARCRSVTAFRRRSDWAYVTFGVTASSQAAWGGISGTPDAADNLIIKSNFSDGSVGSWSTGYASVPSPVPTFADNCIALNRRDSHEWDNEFDIREKETLFVSADMTAWQSPWAVRIGVRATKPDGTAQWIAGASIPAGAGWTSAAGSLVVPDGYTRARPWLGIDDNQLGAVLPAVWVANPRISRSPSSRNLIPSALLGMDAAFKQHRAIHAGPLAPGAGGLADTYTVTPTDDGIAQVFVDYQVANSTLSLSGLLQARSGGAFETVESIQTSPWSQANQTATQSCRVSAAFPVTAGKSIQFRLYGAGTGPNTSHTNVSWVVNLYKRTS